LLSARLRLLRYVRDSGVARSISGIVLLPPFFFLDRFTRDPLVFPNFTLGFFFPFGSVHVESIRRPKALSGVAGSTILHFFALEGIIKGVSLVFFLYLPPPFAHRLSGEDSPLLVPSEQSGRAFLV